VLQREEHREAAAYTCPCWLSSAGALSIWQSDVSSMVILTAVLAAHRVLYPSPWGNDQKS
jgi:hypothetical protein